MQFDFISTVMEMRGGKVASDISAKFGEVIAAVLANGGAGKLTLSLTVKPARVDIHEGVKEVVISHDVKMTKPERSIGPSTFFVARDGSLTRTDPQQSEMFEEEHQHG